MKNNKTTDKDISAQAMLVSLHVGVMTNTTKHKEATQVVADHYHADAKKAGKYSAYKLNPEHFKELTKAAGELRTYHMQRTVAWGNDGKRALSNLAYFQYTQDIADLQGKFWNAYQTFEDNYLANVAEAKQFRNGMFNSADYPDLYSLKDKFYCKLDFAPMPLTDDFRRSLTGEALDTVVAAHEAALQEKIDNTLADVASRIKDVLGHCSESLRAYAKDANGKVQNKFHDTLITNIRDLASLLPSLNITGNQDFASLVDDLDQVSAYSPDTLRDNTPLRNKVADDADAILKKLEGFF